MIIILEGINGVGKTTCARFLSEHLGISVFRPFRDDGEHWDGSIKQKMLERFDVPVNTHVDDLYTADFLATSKSDGILDRSAASAVAYGKLADESGALSMGDIFARDLLNYWQYLIRLSPGSHLYVWLRASYDVSKARCDGRWFPSKKQWSLLDKWFGIMFQRSIQLDKRQINTDEITTNDIVRSICHHLKK